MIIKAFKLGFLIVGVFLSVSLFVTNNALAKTPTSSGSSSPSSSGSSSSSSKGSSAPKAADIPKECSKSFFGLTPWYRYLGPNFKSDLADNDIGGPCQIKCFRIIPAPQSGGCGRSGNVTDVPYVLLAVIDSIARISGLVAVAFVLSGAFRYITSSGNPEATARARSTIINALIGVAVVVVAIGFITFLGRSL